MTARKPGDKTMRFLGKRMRLVVTHGTVRRKYISGNWEVLILGSDDGYRCSVFYELLCLFSSYHPTAEAAIADCEAQALALFKQLGELAGYTVEA